MSQNLKLQVAKDHIEKIAKVNGIKGLVELIWNSLDADAHAIDIRTFSNKLGVYALEIEDDGHGMTYEDGSKAFSLLGGSNKMNKKVSKQHRLLHGSAGQGRLKVFSLGNLVEFQSNYQEGLDKHSFTIQMDRNKLSDSSISDLKTGFLGNNTGVKVYIQNVHHKNINQILSDKGIEEIQEHFSFYYSKYPNFTITIDGKALDFTKSIKNTKEETFKFEINYEDSSEIETVAFQYKIVEWQKSQSKKIFLCGTHGTTFLEHRLSVHTEGYPITVHIISSYIDKLKDNGLLEISEMDNVIIDAIQLANEVTQQYVADRYSEDAKKYIRTLKEQGVYPFEGTPKSKKEQTVRTAFNEEVVNLQSQYPKINELDNSLKKLFLNLLKDKHAKGILN